LRPPAHRRADLTPTDPAQLATAALADLARAVGVAADDERIAVLAEAAGIGDFYVVRRENYGHGDPS
jgi:hypothetical protein